MSTDFSQNWTQFMLHANLDGDLLLRGGHREKLLTLQAFTGILQKNARIKVANSFEKYPPLSFQVGIFEFYSLNFKSKVVWEKCQEKWKSNSVQMPRFCIFWVHRFKIHWISEWPTWRRHLGIFENNISITESLYSHKKQLDIHKRKKGQSTFFTLKFLAPLRKWLRSTLQFELQKEEIREKFIT